MDFAPQPGLDPGKGRPLHCATDESLAVQGISSGGLLPALTTYHGLAARGLPGCQRECAPRGGKPCAENFSSYRPHWESESGSL